MAEENNVHVKVAMADVLALFAISMFTFAVAGFGLGGDTDWTLLTLVGKIGPIVATVCLIATVAAFLNENLLGTAIFGPLAVFFTTITATGMGMNESSWLCILIGIIILIDAIVAFAQPVKLLPILLIVAAIAFFVTALFYNGMITGDDGLRMIVGVLWMVYSLISFYMAAAIMLLVMKGKQVLPLMIKA
ncbi:MAG: hypothetical protein LUQ09_06485 [Methanomassiliicoccales archaeon]|nr:hypothetical protein [Methanomassiliicoccales archaeon]